MKKTIFILAALFLLPASLLFSQEVIKMQPCNDTAILRQADSIRQFFSKQGYDVYKEASIMMESEYEMPVIAPLNERTSYQIIFIGDYSSKLYEVRMYDWDEKMVTYQKKMWDEIDGNIISFAYVPKFSEFHMIKPVQVNKKKKKNLCGYVMLLVKTRP
ncbi:MAG TPA: hypothetical protein VFR58_12215 [Flavisolibacter sp.]|nr:hypothetical protein [Flavisolibacter sp.]